MGVEFVDTNVLIYANDRGAGRKYEKAGALLIRLAEARDGALSTQVLAEFYSAVTRKLAMKSEEAEAVIANLGVWAIHRPSHESVLSACRLQRRYGIAWWDALLVESAIEMEASVLWSEDLNHGQRYGSVTVRNPFR